MTGKVPDQFAVKTSIRQAATGGNSKTKIFATAGQNSDQQVGPHPTPRSPTRRLSANTDG
jgi:hypothetical protein